MSETTVPSIREAYKAALRQYKPWHQHGAWNSTGNDAFWQLIRGGLENNLFEISWATAAFGVPETRVAAWANGEIPDRKVRIRVWKALKSHLDIAAPR